LAGKITRGSNHTEVEQKTPKVNGKKRKTIRETAQTRVKVLTLDEDNKSDTSRLGEGPCDANVYITCPKKRRPGHTSYHGGKRGKRKVIRVGSTPNMGGERTRK